VSPAGQRVGTASFFTCTCCSGPGDELEGQKIGCNVSEAVDASIDKADAALRAPNLFAGARRTSPLARPLLIPCRALNFAAAAITGAAIARPKTQKQRDGRDLRPLPPVTISYDIQEAAENSAAGCGVAVCPLRWRRRRRHRCLRHRRSSPSSIKPLCESPGEAGSHVPGRLMSFIMIGVTCTPALKHCHLPAGWQRFGRVCGRGRGRQVGQCGLCCLHSSSSSSAGGRGLLEPGQASLMPRSDTALALAQPLPCLSWLPTVPPPDLRTCPLLPTAALRRLQQQVQTLGLAGVVAYGATPGSALLCAHCREGISPPLRCGPAAFPAQLLSGVCLCATAADPHTSLPSLLLPRFQASSTRCTTQLASWCSGAGW
jgi:hypothetical protein